ncbi:MAG: hypothetical protein KDJ52_03590 [Anaerolineae bacterium]|nr:hypothetical protein [Anaerolineae bacterium]
MVTIRKLQPNLLLTVIFISIGLTLIAYAPHLWDKYQVPKDLQNFYWMARYQDTDLFPIDYIFVSGLTYLDIFGYKLTLYPISFGYGLVFFVASFFINFIWFAKFLILILLPLCLIYLFKLAESLRDQLSAISLSLIFTFFMLASYQSVSIGSGLQRGIIIPLLIVFVYYLSQQRYKAAAITIFMSGLFYWPAFPLAVLGYGFSLIKWQHPYKFTLDLDPKKIAPFFVSVSLAAIVLVWGLTANTSFVKPQDLPVINDPNFSDEGAIPLFISFPWFGRAGIFDAGTDIVNFIVLAIFAGVILKLSGRQALRRIPAAGWYLLAAGWVMYVASFITLVGFSSSVLYQPSRYTRAVIFLFMILFVGLNWPDFLQKFPGWVHRKRPQIIFFFVALALSLAVAYGVFPSRLLLIPLLWFFTIIGAGGVTLLGGSSWYWLRQTPQPSRTIILIFTTAVTLLVGFYYINNLSLKPINPSPDERNIYQFVSTLPKDAIFAGAPIVMSGIPLFSERGVLFRDLHPHANPSSIIFIPEYFEAQYAQSPQVILDFCQKYKVTHLVLNMAQFDPDFITKQKFFYEPWNSEILKKLSPTPPTDFLLPTVPSIYSSGPYRVIECSSTSLIGNK